MKIRLFVPALLLVLSTACGPPRFDLGRILPEAPPPPPPTPPAPPPTRPAPVAGRVAYFRYETPTAPTKQCVYDLAGSPYVRTVPANWICPLTITVKP